MSGDVKRSVHTPPNRTGFLEEGNADKVRMVDKDHPLPVGSSEAQPVIIGGQDLTQLTQDIAEIKRLMKGLFVIANIITEANLDCEDF